MCTAPRQQEARSTAEECERFIVRDLHWALRVGTREAEDTCSIDKRDEAAPYPVHRYSFGQPQPQPEFTPLPMPNHQSIPFYETVRAGPSTIPIPQLLAQPPPQLPRSSQPPPMKNHHNPGPMDIPTVYSVSGLALANRHVVLSSHRTPVHIFLAAPPMIGVERIGKAHRMSMSQTTLILASGCSK